MGEAGGTLVKSCVIPLSCDFLGPSLTQPTLQKRHIRDILGRTKKICHTYDTSMTIIVTKPGIIIDVVGSYFYDKKIMTENGIFVLGGPETQLHDILWAVHDGKKPW